MMRTGTLLGWLAAAMLANAAASAQEGEPPASTPEAAVERLLDGLVEVAVTRGDEPAEDRYAALLPIVTATHDLPYIAELTVRREWAGLTDEQRERFVAAFVRLSVMTYATRFAGLEEGMFVLADEGAPPEDTRAVVEATLTTGEGEQIPFEYVLHEVDGGWKIINILADRVSDLALKRAEYRRLLADGTIEDVIAALERQAADAQRTNR